MPGRIGTNLNCSTATRCAPAPNVGLGVGRSGVFAAHARSLTEERRHRARQTTQNEVLRQCEAAEPHYGELWTAISKDVKNWRLKTRDVLQLVVQNIPAL